MDQGQPRSTMLFFNSHAGLVDHTTFLKSKRVEEKIKIQK
jgi:hypothetical protein